MGDERKNNNTTQSADKKTFEIKLILPTPPRSVARFARTVTRKLTQNRFAQYATRKFRSTSPRRLKLGLAGAAIVLVPASYFLSQNQPPVYDSAPPTSAAPALTQGTPEYDTVLPKGKDIAVLGGWTRVSPPDGNPVFAYVDTIGDATISVSQQPLPDEFKKDTDNQVAQLAQNFNASERITLGNMTVHIGTSVEGPQSIIFHKEGLLVLIKSKTTIETDQWAAYIDSLE